MGFALLYMSQEKFIFLDEELDIDYSFESEVPFEELNLPGVEKGQLNALHFTTKNPKGVILYFHGNRGNLTRWGGIVSPLTQYGYDVLVMDYRGFGKSKGKRSQQNLIADAELFYSWCRDRYGEDRIVLFGRSLGTGLASYLAGSHQPLKVILETPYYSLAKAAQRFYPIYPAKLALKYNFKSFEYLQNAICDIYLFHGTDDTVVPYQHSEDLVDHLSAQRVSLITIPEGEHRNLSDFDLYHVELEKILK
jgi:alpha-beta hydrolase superfamily lysophospholipase